MKFLEAAQKYAKRIFACDFHFAKTIVEASPDMLFLQFEINNSSEYFTPLCAASSSGCESLITYFVTKGANVNDRCIHGTTPLMAAAKGNHTSTAKLLLDLGADPNLSNYNITLTPFHIAVLNNNAELVRIFLDHNININSVTSEGLSALHLACSSGFVQLAATLLENHNVCININDKKGLTPVHYATISNDTDMIKLLYLHGADLDSQSNQKITPAYHGYDNVIQFLIAHGAKTFMTDEHGRTPLDYAKTMGHEYTYKTLAKGFAPSYESISQFFNHSRTESYTVVYHPNETLSGEYEVEYFYN